MSESRQEINALLNRLVSKKDKAETQMKNDIKDTLDRLGQRDKIKKVLKNQKQELKDQKYSNRFAED